MHGQVSNGILALVVASCLVGCSATKTVELSDHSLYSEINDKGSTKTARVLLNSGQIFVANGLRIDADSTSFIVSEEEVLRDRIREVRHTQSVATSEIREVQFQYQNHGAGARIGALAGAATAVGLGFVALFVTGEELGLGVAGAPWMALFGGSIGLVIGGAAGKSGLYVYQMPATQPQPRDLGEDAVSLETRIMKARRGSR